MAQTIINHESDTIGLAELARKVENEGIGYSDAIKRVKIGNFDTFADFLSYFNAHYKPMLKRLRMEEHEQLMGFFIDDMLSAFGEDESN